MHTYIPASITSYVSAYLPSVYLNSNRYHEVQCTRYRVRRGAATGGSEGYGPPPT